MIETRMSISLPLRRILMRPSWGSRCSAMFRFAMIFTREITAACCERGTVNFS
jgi:hypothetical protein